MGERREERWVDAVDPRPLAAVRPVDRGDLAQPADPAWPRATAPSMMDWTFGICGRSVSDRTPITRASRSRFTASPFQLPPRLLFRCTANRSLARSGTRFSGSSSHAPRWSATVRTSGSSRSSGSASLRAVLPLRRWTPTSRRRAFRGPPSRCRWGPLNPVPLASRRRSGTAHWGGVGLSGSPAS